MLKFLGLWRAAAAPRPESQRDRLDRLVGELNAAIDELPDKPPVTIDPATGHLSLTLPEQLPDEALALPAPAEPAPPTPVPPSPEPPKPAPPESGGDAKTSAAATAAETADAKAG